MRRNTRCIFLLILAFMLVVSYKILEPEVKKQAYDDRPKRDLYDVYDNKVAAPVKTEAAAAPDSDLMDLPLVSGVVQDLIKGKSLQFDTPLSSSPWDVAASWVTGRTIFPENAPELGVILNKLSTQKILSADVGFRGTQLKLTLTLEGGQRVVFKPKWYDRDFVIIGLPYDGGDRHNAELAAFHLNRLLGFRRAPLVAGRYVNLKTEIFPVATQRLKDTFFEYNNNTCFYGQCLYCKGPKDGVCADGVMLEGIVSLWLPDKVQMETSPHPWRRSYRANKKMRWETDENYCESVKQSPPYDSGTRLLDILDATMHDYLIGNADRHHYETFKGVKDSMIVMLDSAKSFGNPYVDEDSILAPLRQCCMLRKSTWERLLLLQNGALGLVMRRLLSQDILKDVLHPPHYQAMDRRLVDVIKTVRNCMSRHGESDVLIAGDSL